MDKFIPVTWLKVAALPSVTGPAFFRSAKEDDGIFLVTGGADPQAVFIAGSHFGKSFRAKMGSSRTGAFIDGIDILVDLSSAFSPEKTGYLEGAYALVGNLGSVIGGTRGSFGFEDTFGWNLETGEGVEHLGSAIAYSRWRICKSDGETRVTLAEVVADSNG